MKQSKRLNRIRLALSLTGAGIVAAGIMVKGGGNSGLPLSPLFSHPLIMLIGGGLFLIGLYSPETGFKGLGRSSIGDFDGSSEAAGGGAKGFLHNGVSDGDSPGTGGDGE